MCRRGFESCFDGFLNSQSVAHIRLVEQVHVAGVTMSALGGDDSSASRKRKSLDWLASSKMSSKDAMRQLELGADTNNLIICLRSISI